MFTLPFLKRTPDAFGLDIGSSAVKAVQLRVAPEGRSLAALAAVPLPADAIADGAIKDPPTVVEAIREAVGRAGIRSPRAVIGLAGRELIVKKLQLPAVPAKELRDAVQLEAEHHIPFAIDEVFLDYDVIRADGSLDLIVVAVKKSKVLEYVAVVEEAGLEPAVVDVDSFALGNQHEANQAQDTDEVVALIDVGAAVMKTNVVKGRVSLFARDIAFGGNNYTQAIAQQLKIPAEQAEAAKCGQDTGVAWETMVPALEAVSRELSLEVQRTFDYFASTTDSERIGRIVLAGGAARLPGLTDYLASTWGIPVEAANPFARITVDPAHADAVAAGGPALAVAVGLALRHPGDKRA